MGNCTCATGADTRPDVNNMSEPDINILSKPTEGISAKEELCAENMEDRRAVDRDAAVARLKQRLMLIELRAIARLGCETSDDVDWDELEDDVILLGRLCVELYML